ncbi:MAG TPA: haloalkane dehalogenase [Bryobacteraceae bacterium]|nr:haloalkane dehalogenase [Bryobacteraceae bacterium]
MDFIKPSAAELSLLRADPLLWEQELDVRPEFASALERACGTRAGRVYWRSAHDHLYAMELADLGRGRPSMAMIFGHWDRYEPRPPEHEIDADLLALCDWLARVAGLNPSDIAKVAQHAGIVPRWPENSVLRTPDDRFQNLPGFPYAPRYTEVEGLRMAYVESGEGNPILCLHGEPTWSYLYRRMIPALSKIGRVIVPDLIGFGRSDKPVTANAYTYKSHARWMRAFIRSLDLKNITLVCQDWGGLIGLRVLSQMAERFARVVAMNTGLPIGAAMGDAFLRWRRFSQRVDALDVPLLMRNSLRRVQLTEAEGAAYQAPFPSKKFQTGALIFPRLVPTRPDHPGAFENRQALEVLKTLDLPVLLAFGSEDPITAAAEPFLRSIFKNSATAPISRAGHFIQDDAGEEVAEKIVRWMEA